MIPYQNNKKATQYTQMISIQKSKASRKSLNHKQKIVNVIKKSNLKPETENKHKNFSKSRNSISNRGKTKKSYQINSQRTRSNKTVTNSLLKTLPVKNTNQKLQQFPFEVIKFRQKFKLQSNQNKTHDEFQLRYDEPNSTQMELNIMQNSKKIIGSIHQRIGRYSDLKSKSKQEFVTGVKNVQYRETVVKLFKFLDPNNTRVISHSSIDYRKVPQAVLYFLGGLFQKIREKNLYLSQKEFSEQCDQIYLRSSSEDVKWFIEEANLVSIPSEQKPKQITQTNILIKNIETEGTNKFVSQQSKVQEKIEIQKENQIQPTLSSNISFRGYNPGISFRKQDNDNISEYDSKHNNRSQRESYHSAKFGSEKEYRFSFNLRQITPEICSLKQKPEKEKQQKKQTQKILIDYQLNNRPENFKSSIKKNNLSNVQDIRSQIYAKLDKLKINPQPNGDNIVTQTFKKDSKWQPTNKIINDESRSKQNFKPPLAKNHPCIVTSLFSNQTSKFKSSNQPRSTLKQPLMQIKQSNQSKEQQNLLIRPQKVQNKAQKEAKPHSSIGWINKVKNCSSAFEQLKIIKDQFNNHKNTIEIRQIERQNYFKDKQNQRPSIDKKSDFTLYQQTRIINIAEDRPNRQQTNDHQYITTNYQRNIDRLTNLSNSRRNQKGLPINLNDTLSNSCRKSVEISIPLKSDQMKLMSLSDKKSVFSAKIDKIDQLSSKLQEYLMKNAQKIEYSKNFTQQASSTKFNRFLAM